MQNNRLFVYDEIIKDRADFCNCTTLINSLVLSALGGRRVVLYGRRDTGKTSLIKSIVIPSFKAEALRLRDYEGGETPFVMFCDLMGVKTLDSIARRLRASFETAFSESFYSQALFLKILGKITSLRPVASVSDSGKLKLSIESQSGIRSNSELPDIFAALTKVMEGRKALLVFDEFQDISFVDEAEALLRDFFQNMHGGVSLIISGSKKHLLSRIFSSPSAPLSGFGESRDIEKIPFDEYTQYINDRFQKENLTIDLDTSTYLQEKLGRIPEPINIICQRIVDLNISGELGSSTEDGSASGEPSPELRQITKQDVGKAIENYIQSEAGKFEELAQNLTPPEEKLAIAIAKYGPIKNPYSSEFLSLSGLPLGSVQRSLPKLENEAILYREKEGIVLSKPLLSLYLQVAR